jgi:transposase
METMERKQPRPRRSLTPEFEAEIVEHCRRHGRSIRRVARDWVTQAHPHTEWSTSGDRNPGFMTHKHLPVSRNGG